MGCRIDGGQAEYVRVPYADRGLNHIPDTVSDEQALLVGDVLATGFWAARISEITEDDTVLIIDISTPAEETLSAKGLDIHGHPVTRLDCSNIGTHLFHHTNHLMPNGYSGYRTWYATVFNMKIARTNATQSHSYDSVP